MRGHRVPEEHTFRPFLVDQAEDLMCFATTSHATYLPNNVTSKLLSSFSIPPSIKIHQSIYSYISNTMAYNTELPADISVAHLMNTSSNHLEQGDIELLYQAAKNLVAYPTDILEDFFWTSSSTQYYFADKISQADKRDNEKAVQWKELADYLQSLLDIDVQDPCKFGEMSIQRHGVSRLLSSMKWAIMNSC